MSKRASDVLDDEPIYRVETVPPPDDEDEHSRDTRIGDWSLAVEEMRHASTSTKATAKVTAFDLAAALARTKSESQAPPPPPPVTSSATRLRAPAIAVAAEVTCEPATDHVVVEELTIEVEEPLDTRAPPGARSSKPRTPLALIGNMVLQLLIAMAIVAVFATVLGR